MAIHSTPEKGSSQNACEEEIKTVYLFENSRMHNVQPTFRETDATGKTQMDGSHFIEHSCVQLSTVFNALLIIILSSSYVDPPTRISVSIIHCIKYSMSIYYH